MNILFDDHIIKNNKTGLYRYTKNIIEGIENNKNIHLSLYTKINPLFDNGLYRILYGFSKAINSYQPDILHVQNFTPFNKTTRIVNIVHDLCFLEDPQSFSFKSRIAFLFFFKHSLQISDHIIVISESVKKQLIQKYKISDKKIDVVYDAAEDCFQHILDKEMITQTLQKFRITKPFFLVVGSESKRKNIQPIIKAHAELLKTNPDILLIITGKVKTSHKNILYVSNISDTDLNLLYNGAQALIMNSSCEGFGLPLVEAMQCKTPIICNDIEVFHEICRNSAIFTRTPQEITSAMKLLLVKSNYIKYSFLSHNESKRFSWNLTTKKTLEVYNKVLKNK